MGAMQAWATLVTAALAITAATTIATTTSALLCLRGTVHNNAFPDSGQIFFFFCFFF